MSFQGWKKTESIHVDLGVKSVMYYALVFCGKNKSNTLSTLIWKKICLIGNFVGENWWSWRTREQHCFFSLKCFHSLNKFNKTSFDWQERALPQCLLFALTFLVSSCAPFWMRWRLKICSAHTHTIDLEQVGLLYKSPQAWMCYSWHISEVLFCVIESFVNSAGVQYKLQSHHSSRH